MALKKGATRKKAVVKKELPLFDLPEPKPNNLLIKKREIQKPDLNLLKGDQPGIFKELYTTATGRGNIGSAGVLNGYAGTGKSYLISRLIEELLFTYRGMRIACTATTNKAVKIGYRMAEYHSPNLEFVTIHKLLGLKEKITNNGEQIFVQDKQNPPNVEQYDLVFTDEFSMLHNMLLLGSDDMYGLQYYRGKGLNLIFVGDSAQIPVVKSKETILSSHKERMKLDIKFCSMEKVLRQALDNPILDLATRIRSNLNLPKDHIYYDMQKVNINPATNEGVIFLDRAIDEDMNYFDKLLAHLFKSENFYLNTDFAKVLCYTNKMVDRINGMIRRIMYDGFSTKRIEVGEKLIANSPIFYSEINQREDISEGTTPLKPNTIIMPTNEEMEVLEYKERLYDVYDDGSFIIPFYWTKVKYLRFDNSEKIIRIPIVTKDGMKVYKHIVDVLIEHAKSLPQGTIAAGVAWSNKYAFERLFADVGYNYAVTMHTSQGSTYENVIAFESDLEEKNNRINERNRILYTAVTRASKHSWIL